MTLRHSSRLHVVHSLSLRPANQLEPGRRRCGFFRRLATAGSTVWSGRAVQWLLFHNHWRSGDPPTLGLPYEYSTSVCRAASRVAGVTIVARTGALPRYRWFAWIESSLSPRARSRWCARGAELTGGNSTHHVPPKTADFGRKASASRGRFQLRRVIYMLRCHTSRSVVARAIHILARTARVPISSLSVESPRLRLSK